MSGEEHFKRKMKKLQEKIRIVSKILEYMKEGVLIFDESGKIRAVNNAFLSITGLNHEFLYGRDVFTLNLKWEGFPTFIEVMNMVKREGVWQGEVRGVHRNGSLFTSEVSLVKVDNDDKTYIAIFLDTTDKRSLEESLKSLAYYDSLTGLPNRALLYDHLSHAILKAKSKKRKLGVIFFDIDNFKLINDTLGHDAGDSLLKAFSHRLVSHFPSETLVSRFGSDEFVVVVDLVEDIKDVEELVSRFLKDVTTPFFINGQKIYVTVTAGISIYPVDGSDPQTLLKNADIAMHHAKEFGKSSYKFFTSELNIKVSERFALEAELRDALEREEFVLYYQPQFDLSTNRMVGVEALLRWHHPDKGVILPSRFIHVVEEMDLIIPLGEWILKRACSDGKRLLAEGFPLKMAVNISANQISAENFIPAIKKILSETEFDPNYLEIEITESALMRNKQQAAKVLRELKNMGISRGSIPVLK